MSFRTLLLSLLVLPILFASCKSNKEVVEAASATPTPEDNSSAAIYTLTQGGCFGNCPIYTFEMFADGNVKMDKKKHMSSPGKYEMALDNATTMSLIRDLDKAKFMKMEDEYESMIPDMALTTMSYKKAGELKTVKGKENLPESLRAIQDKVEMIMKSPGWKQTEAYEISEEDMPKELIMDELLIQPQEGVSLSRWMLRYKKEGMRLLDRIDEKNRIWLFTWNTNSIPPRKFMSILQKDPDLKSVEFNYVTEER